MFHCRTVLWLYTGTLQQQPLCTNTLIPVIFSFLIGHLFSHISAFLSEENRHTKYNAISVLPITYHDSFVESSSPEYGVPGPLAWNTSFNILIPELYGQLLSLSPLRAIHSVDSLFSLFPVIIIKVSQTFTGMR